MVKSGLAGVHDTSGGETWILEGMTAWWICTNVKESHSRLFSFWLILIGDRTRREMGENWLVIVLFLSCMPVHISACMWHVACGSDYWGCYLLCLTTSWTFYIGVHLGVSVSKDPKRALFANFPRVSSITGCKIIRFIYLLKSYQIPNLPSLPAVHAWRLTNRYDRPVHSLVPTRCKSTFDRRRWDLQNQPEPMFHVRFQAFQDS